MATPSVVDTLGPSRPTADVLAAIGFLLNQCPSSRLLPHRESIAAALARLEGEGTNVAQLMLLFWVRKSRAGLVFRIAHVPLPVRAASVSR